MMNIFPLNPDSAALGQAFTVYTDPRCTVKAPVFDTSGRPIPASQITVTGKQIPQFQSTATVLYARDTAGIVETLYPHPFASSPAVTGAKGGNAALTSLIAALAAQGIITDQTS
jgi:hypothetical protein